MSQQISILSCLQAPRYTLSHFAITKLPTLYLYYLKASQTKCPQSAESAYKRRTSGAQGLDVEIVDKGSTGSCYNLLEIVVPDVIIGVGLMESGHFEDCSKWVEDCRRGDILLQTFLCVSAYILVRSLPVFQHLKPTNILLDRNFLSKISDVGLTRLVPPSVADSVTQYHMTFIVDTFCYIDLEAIEKGTLSEMLDPSLSDWPQEDALTFAKHKDKPYLGKVVLLELNRLRNLVEDTNLL
ncbi:hypothetical protein V8G54_000928 [Vigna mungo]|uniref:RING-type E3 ubiquitin transferase n=1 Tax=Vigna mungo TaxID=3915 RepID=A0AAQ3SBA9_VIGMU